MARAASETESNFAITVPSFDSCMTGRPRANVMFSVGVAHLRLVYASLDRFVSI